MLRKKLLVLPIWQSKISIKNTWKIINSVINKSSSYQLTSGISNNENFIANSTAMADHLNKYCADTSPNFGAPVTRHEPSDIVKKPSKHK